MTPVILLAHGSPDPRAGESARVLATEVGRRTGREVRAAFLQHDAASLAVVAADLQASGESAGLVIPTLVSRAFHARVDVPAEVDQARRSSGLRLDVTEPLGPDPSLLAAMDRDLPPGPRVLAAAGTTDVQAQRQVTRLADLWAERTGFPTVAAYVAMAQPDVPSALADIEARTGARAGVGSFVLFPGVLPDRLVEDADGRPVSRPLSTSPELIELVVRRVNAAVRRVA